MKAVVIIPARYNSARFEGKPIAHINGKPMIEYVYQGAKGAGLIDRVIIATDDERIFEAVKDFGGEAVITSTEHSSGTDRVAEVAKNLSYDIIVNVQGDEPLIKGEMIDDVIKLLEDQRADMGTLKKRIKKTEELYDPNVVKVVTDSEGFALYFSRSPIPYYRDEFPNLQPSNVRLSDHDKVFNLQLYKHIGIYSYRTDVLLKLTALRESMLEKAEKLEQLRAIDNGYRIKAKETEHDIIGVDTRNDLERVEKWLNTYL